MATPVRRFVDAVAGALEEVGSTVEGVRPTAFRQDAALEAFNLTCGLLATDGRQSDDEVWELLAAFGPLLETRLAGTTPADLRETGLIARQAGFTDEPSALFEVLLAADAKQGTGHGRTYYDRAVEVAFSVAAIDLHTSQQELEGIERLRGMLLAAIDAMEATRAARPGGVGVATAASSPGAPTPVPASDDPPARPIDELLAELDDLVGLEGVKHEVKLVTNLLRVQAIREERGLPVLDHSRHLIFTGNPGTGKTTVARLLAQIYRTLGVVERGHLVETDRSGLVAGYVGQTAPLVTARFDEADEGVLLIDEAYSLVRGGERDFGREAIDTIVKLSEDRRDRIVVVMAGYPEEMEELISANPGLRSRFPKVIHFPDYTTEELLSITDSLGERSGYHLDDGAGKKAAAWFDAIERVRGFGNGRTARNLFEHAVGAQATRLVELESPTDEELTTLVADDLPEPGTGPVTVSPRAAEGA
ncbi:MAG: AAA family ATPase [Acidimicrobiales bacterium]|nr:AAA family ATPase [Acidimicrobiales bacterium]